MQPNRTDWLSVHRDDQLSATSPLMGKPGEPREQWRVFLGGRIRVAETVESLTTPGHLDLLIIDRGGIHRVTAGGATVWCSRPAGYWLIACTGDIDADGNTEIVATDGIHIHVLDARNGERIWAYRMPPSAGVQPASITAHTFSGARGIQLVVGIMYSTDLLVIDWEAGARNGRVRTLHTDDMYHPALFIADMDNDGEEEIVVTKLCGIYQFSPATLALKKSYTWLSDGRRLRNYGLFQAVDVNNDGRLEVVVLASLVARHLAVVGNDGAGNLSVWWDRYIEMIYPTDTTEVRWVMNSVADVNGDGRPEIAVSLFNTRGDGRWWSEIIDPLDGRLLAELPDSYLWECARYRRRRAGRDTGIHCDAAQRTAARAVAGIPLGCLEHAHATDMAGCRCALRRALQVERAGADGIPHRPGQRQRSMACARYTSAWVSNLEARRREYAPAGHRPPEWRSASPGRTARLCGRTRCGARTAGDARPRWGRPE